MQKIISCLWFNGNAEPAVDFYLSVFRNSRLTDSSRYSGEICKEIGIAEGTISWLAFELEGEPFLAINGGPEFAFSPATSHIINCETQDEIDYYWDKLIEGGKPHQCGWLDDKFGVTWQVVPTDIGKLLATDDPTRNARVMAAMMPMVKLDVSVLRAAYDNK